MFDLRHKYKGIQLIKPTHPKLLLQSLSVCRYSGPLSAFVHPYSDWSALIVRLEASANDHPALSGLALVRRGHRCPTEGEVTLQVQGQSPNASSWHRPG